MRFPAAHTSTGHTHILRMDGKVFGLGRPIITVVQPTQSIMGKHATRGYAASSAPRRSLAQSKMCAVLVMVGDVLGKEPLQVSLVQSNHMVEQLTAAAPHPTLGDTICQGLSNDVRTAFIFRDRMAAGTSVPYFASRSWIRNLGAAPNGNASRNCWMIQQLVGCLVTLKCRIRRRSWRMTKKQ